jgi:hypothetical protein
MNAALRVFPPIEQMRPDQLIEACKDPHWRLRHLYKIKDKNGQVVMLWVAEANCCPSANGML